MRDLTDPANINDEVIGNLAKAAPAFWAEAERMREAMMQVMTSLNVVLQPIVERMNAFAGTSEFHAFLTELRETRHNRDDRRALLVEGMFDEVDE